MPSLFGSPTFTKRKPYHQLSDSTFYLKVDEDLTTHHQKIVKDTINSFISDGSLPQTASNLIHTTPRTSHIYFLPKIHKVNNPGRPIVSACSCPTLILLIILFLILLHLVFLSSTAVTIVARLKKCAYFKFWSLLICPRDKWTFRYPGLFVFLTFFSHASILLFPFVFYVPISLRCLALHRYITTSLIISHAFTPTKDYSSETSV